MESNTKLEFTSRYGKFSIECGDLSDSSFGELVEYLIKPVFLAAGYQPSTLEQYFGECTSNSPPPIYKSI